MHTAHGREMFETVCHLMINGALDDSQSDATEKLRNPNWKRDTYEGYMHLNSYDSYLTRFFNISIVGYFD